MNWETFRILFAHEVRMLMRDRRTVIFAVLIPIVVWPIAIFGTRKMSQRREEQLKETVFKYAIVGREADYARQLIQEGRDRAAEAAAESNSSAKDNRSFKFQEERIPDASKGLQAGTLHFYIEASS